MSSREEILQSIRCATMLKHEKPDLTVLEEHAITYPDVVAQFCDMIKQVGGEAILLKEEEDVNEVIKKKFPDAQRIASNLPGITCAALNPDDMANPAELDGTDLAIVDGRLGVAENAAIWIEQDVKQRAVYFISEKLVILLNKKDLVNNMHEAYTKIDTGKYGFGVFISGPSKTADIEQALVMGAHGAQDVLVLIN